MYFAYMGYLLDGLMRHGGMQLQRHYYQKRQGLYSTLLMMKYLHTALS